jgi:VWFA-related protein
MSKFGFVILTLCCLLQLALAQEAPSARTAATQPPATAAPQTPAVVPQVEQLTPGHEGGRITLDVVVTDKSGTPVSGLELKDFTLLDNKLPAKILSFQAIDGTVLKPGPRVEVAIVIDAVNLPFGQVAIERQQIVGFLQQNGGHLAEPTTVYVMTDSGVTSSGRPTLDGNALAEATNKLDIGLRTTGQSAGAWGAIQRMGFSLHGFTTIASSEAKKPGRKLLIWAGPGWPMLNGLHYQTDAKGQQQVFNTIVELSDKLRQARISVYSVARGMPGINTFLYQDYLKGVKAAEKAESANLALKVLSVQSGGRVMVPDNDMTGQIDRCIRDATAFYTISFDPPRADRANEYHDLKIEVDKPGLTPLTKSGYYGQP